MSFSQRSQPKKSGIQQCQRCLKYGHWTFECKNEVAYTYRPSRTMQYKEPHLRPSLNTDKAPKGPIIGDGDFARTVKRDESDEEIIKIDLSSLSSSSSEKEADKKNESSSNSDDDSSSSSSSDSSVEETDSKDSKNKKNKKIDTKNQNKLKKPLKNLERSRSRSTSPKTRKTDKK